MTCIKEVGMSIPYVQIKKTLFNAVIEAEEALLAEQASYASLWAAGADSSSSSEAGSDDERKPAWARRRRRRVCARYAAAVAAALGLNKC